MPRTIVKLAPVVLVPALFAFFACGGPKNNGGTGGVAPTCQSGSTGNMGSSACLDCLGSKCHSQIESYNGDCYSLGQCESGCMCTDPVCLGKCTATITSACQSSSAALASCSQSNCQAACAANGSSSSSGASSSSSSGGSGGGCSALSMCCTKLSGAAQTGCNQVVTAGDNASCSQELMALQTAGQC
jgi:hypothetical protein